MKIKLLISIFMLVFFSLAQADNYDIARKIQQDSKDVADYQKSRMNGTYVDYSSVTPTWVSVLYGGIGIGILAFLGFVGYLTIKDKFESKNDDKNEETHEITSDNPNAHRWIKMNVSEIAKELNRTERAVMTMLIRHGIKCRDYDGAAKYAAANAAINSDIKPEDREARLNREYIERLKSDDELKKPGNRGIIITIFGEKGVGDSVTSYIACHTSEATLHENYDVYNLIEYDTTADEEKRKGFDDELNVDSLINFYRTKINGPFETTKLYQKNFSKDVAYISIWASTASEYLKECRQYKEMIIEIFWDGVGSKKEEYLVKNTSNGVSEKIVLMGYLVRMKNGKWNFRQSPPIGLDICMKDICENNESLRDPINVVFQKIINTEPQT